MRQSPTLYFFYCVSFLFVSSGLVFGQTSSCPPNIDFSSGSFTNWECRSGFVSGNGGVNSAVMSATGAVADRHQLISPLSRQTDAYGEFPQHCPNTSSYSVQLGNDNNGHEAEGLFYTFTIPSTNTNFSLLYYYAIVMQNPAHSTHEQPRFRARVIDVSTEKEINCVSFDFSSSGSLPGFKPSRWGNAIYKDWTPITVDLSGYAGKTIRLEFITSDCVFQEHFGYAYISINSVCNTSITGNNYCDGDSTTTVTAPYGFAQYTWYSDPSFGRAIGRSQELSLDIRNTPLGTVLPVIVTPYFGYGCQDTLYAVIGSAQKPVSDAGNDITTCSKTPVQLGTVPVSDYAYSWSPNELLSNPFASNPFTRPGILVSTDLVVKTTDLFTGCFSFDTVTITPVLVDTSASIIGERIYCPGERLNATLLAYNNSTAVQWYQSGTPINGETNFSYSPVAVGTYWVQIKQFGCVDSSRQFIIRQAPMPRPDFAINKEIQCVNEPIVFTNQTTIAGNEPIRYSWIFSDGALTSAISPEKSFRTDGIFTATLIATSGTDCTDSIEKQVMIINDCIPVLPTAFTPNNDGKNDKLTPFLVGAKRLKRFTVYNRWGNVVFTTAKEGEGWNGTYNGKHLATDVFVWVLGYEGKNNESILKKGTVTLIR